MNLYLHQKAQLQKNLHIIIIKFTAIIINFSILYYVTYHLYLHRAQFLKKFIQQHKAQSVKNWHIIIIKLTLILICCNNVAGHLYQ